MDKYFKYLFSIPSALILMAVFSISIGLATFIENDLGTIASKSLIFNTWWLELILLSLCAIFIYNIYHYKLLSIRRLPVLFFHLSFLLIIIGSGVTRYFGEEGMMRIREGAFNNQMISSTAHINYKFDNIASNKKEKPLYLVNRSILKQSNPSNIGEVIWNFIIDVLFKIDYVSSYFGQSQNYFSIKEKVGSKHVEIQKVDFIHDPKDKLFEVSEPAQFILELITEGMQSEYLVRNNQKKINNIIFSFDSDKDADFNISYKDSLFYFVSDVDVNYMRMSDRSEGVLLKGQKHILNKKTLYTIGNQNIVFKNYYYNAIIKQVSSGIKNNESKKDLLRVKIVVDAMDTIIDLYGHKGEVSGNSYFQFNGVFCGISYGSNYREISPKSPFAIELNDFQVERYPGSDSPASFASEVTVIDKEESFDYRIFMNNVLDYKGYRFFQSSYDQDELGTILSINKDKPGTFLTYTGYLFLLLSVISLFISRFSRINILSKK